MATNEQKYDYGATTNDPLCGEPLGLWGSVRSGRPRLARSGRRQGTRMVASGIVEHLVIDVDGLLRQHGVILRTNLKAIRFEAGQVVLEA